MFCKNCGGVKIFAGEVQFRYGKRITPGMKFEYCQECFLRLAEMLSDGAEKAEEIYARNCAKEAAASVDASVPAVSEAASEEISGE